MTDEEHTEYLTEWIDYHKEHALLSYEELKDMVKEDERLTFVTEHPDFDGFDDLDDTYEKMHRQYQEASDRIDELVAMDRDDLAEAVGEDEDTEQLWTRVNQEVSSLESDMSDASEQFSEEFEEFFDQFVGR